MAYIRVDDRVINNFKSDNLEAVLNSIIDAELSKDVSQVNTKLVNECIDALIGIEQEKDEKFSALVPLMPPDKFLNKIRPNNFSWKNANVFVRAGVAAAVIAGSAFTVNAAVEEFTGVNLIQSAVQSVQDKLEQWGVINRMGIDVVDGEDDDDDFVKDEETTTVPAVTQEVTEPEVTQIDTAETTSNTENTQQSTKPAQHTTVKKTTAVSNAGKDSPEKPSAQPQTTAGNTETTTNKPIEPTTQKPVVTPPATEEVVRFTGLSAEFDNFKSDYIYGEELSYDGLTLKANYSNGTYEFVNLEDCSYTKNIDMTQTADYTLRIIYNGSILTINITVRPDEETRGSIICHNDLYDYLLTDRGAYITAYSSDETEIVLSTVDGNEVIAIGSGVFEGKKVKFFNADNVEKIFPNAFRNCTQLADCYTPRTISIGSNAFEGCENLIEAVFSSNLSYLGEAVYKGTGIKKIVLPPGITEIPKSLCEECYSLETAELQGTVTSIDDLAFASCTALTKINGTAEVKRVGDYAFADDVLVDCDKPFDKLESAGQYAFSKCNSLNIGTLPSIKEFATASFEYCYLLKSIAIPQEVTEIPKSAFAGTRLTSLELHDGITEIGDYAFMSTMLTEIKLPKSVEKLGTRAFYTTRMRRVYFYNPDVEIDDDVFFAGSRLTFYAYENSTAQRYAEEYDINCEIIEEE